MDKLRIDKWLWAARFYKTRSLAVDELQRGRVRVNGQDAKPSREVKAGDTIELQQGPVRRTVVVRGISALRGPAPVAPASPSVNALPSSVGWRPNQPCRSPTGARPNATDANWATRPGATAGARPSTTEPKPPP